MNDVLGNFLYVGVPECVVKFYLTPAHGYNDQTWKYNIAVWYNQAEWLKKGNISVKCSQPVHNRMNKFQYNIQHNYLIV